MRACGQKFVKFCTLTHAAKLVVEIFIVNKKLLLCNESPQLDSAVEGDPHSRRTGSWVVWKDGGEADGWGGGRTLGVFNYKFVVM